MTDIEIFTAGMLVGGSLALTAVGIIGAVLNWWRRP